MITIKALSYPNIRVGLARNELTTLKRTTVVSLFEVINNFGLQADIHYRYNSQIGEIAFANGSKIILLELAHNPSDPEYTRLGGILLTFGVIDEAGEVSEKGKQIFQSRLGRWKNKTYNIKPIILMTCNPSKNFLYNQFYKASVEGQLEPHRKFIQALITDNKYMDESYHQNLLKTLSPTDKQRLIHGNWDYDSNPNALCNYDDILNIFIYDKVKSQAPTYYLSADIAFTSDAAVIIVWEDLDIIEILVNPANVEEMMKEKARQYNIKPNHITYDSDGVGQYLKQHFLGAKPIVNNSKALNNENYENLKTQLYFKLAQMINTNQLKIKGNEQFKDKIIEELQVIAHKPTENVGKLAIISKGEVKRMIGRSPDFSDAMAYRMIFELKSTRFDIKIDTFTF